MINMLDKINTTVRLQANVVKLFLYVFFLNSHVDIYAEFYIPHSSLFCAAGSHSKYVTYQ